MYHIYGNVTITQPKQRQHSHGSVNWKDRTVIPIFSPVHKACVKHDSRQYYTVPKCPPCS